MACTLVIEMEKVTNPVYRMAAWVNGTKRIDTSRKKVSTTVSCRKSPAKIAVRGEGLHGGAFKGVVWEVLGGQKVKRREKVYTLGPSGVKADVFLVKCS